MRCIFKAARDEDLYGEWSSTVETFTFLGTRAETLRYLTETQPADEAEARLARADKTGTSVLGFATEGDTHPHDLPGAWEDTGLIVEQRGLLPRDRMSDFLRSYRAVGGPDYTLLEPLDDDTN
ncbi:hypothetical protein ABT332_13415 [Saccharomonospora azurea]|uniref:hypothetical protein n=1 Tax=Saccharomonospora azurea TaxID=40988 RepID=UPI00331BB338